MRGFVISLLVLATTAPLTSAQTARQGPSTRQEPKVPSQRADLLPLDAIAVVDVPQINLGGVQKEDRQRELEGLPPRFAIPHEVEITPITHGTWENLDADTLLWRLRVRGFGASSLNLGFGRYYMPAGGELHVYSADLKHVVRPFTADDNESHGELWTPVVLSDAIVIEVAVPILEADRLRLRLTQIGYGYRGFKTSPVGPAPQSGSCNVDVVCPEGDFWRLDIPSVGVISLGGGTFCTGFMVNNQRYDLAPYFMTADHCGVGAGNAASLVVYWNYENSTCRVPGSPASGGPGNGSLSQFNTGSFYRSESSASDFTLVLLDDDPDPSFDVSYAGWDATGSDASAAIAIHHPNTDEKRISFEDQPTTTTSYLGESIPGDGTHVRVIDWDLGTTEPGSSGSPLFNQDHRVIGQLHGGFASCTSQTSDWYGKFSVSWTGGGTNSSRLSNWLDPDSTGNLLADTVSLSTLCSDMGELTMERGNYGCEDTITVRVIDCGLNMNGGAIEQVSITVDSTSELAGETVMLTETGAGTARFEGTLPISGTDGSGVLLVGEGDSITAHYLDADDGMGGFNVPVATNGNVDCTPPILMNVTISNVDATSAVVTIDADEPITAMADYGAACVLLSDTAMGEELSTSSSVTISGLTPGTVYFFRAVGSDEALNTATDDNGGNCYFFTTTDVPNYFTEEYVGDLDLAGQMFEYRQDGGPDGYRLCNRGPIASLPTNPSGGTTLSLSDDGSAFVNIGGGQTFELYGQSRSAMWVNANGNITFGGGDGDYTETLAEHFSRDRIAVLWDDFNPSAGGTVSWRKLSDRVAVTWQNVPEFSTTNSNTFQVELFENGLIRMSYLGLATVDAITGLSDGDGLDPQFVETNLTDGNACGEGGETRRRTGGVDGSSSRSL